MIQHGGGEERKINSLPIRTEYHVVVSSSIGLPWQGMALHRIASHAIESEDVECKLTVRQPQKAIIHKVER